MSRGGAAVRHIRRLYRAMRRTSWVLAGVVGLLAILMAGPAAADDRLEIFDAHLHYNWEPVPYLPLDKVLALFKQHRVTGILATSRPNDGTHALVKAKERGEADALAVVPFIRPYRVRADVGSWFGDPSIFELVTDEFKRGGYRGIGEFHISGKAAASEWVKKTVDFAVANDLYLHAHADAEAIEILFGHNAKARIIWAHTGFGLAPERVAALLTKYPALWGELSYRSGITGSAGQLTPEWRSLFTRFPARFVVGSDTWINERWASYGEIMAEYRAWLAQLPSGVAKKIAHETAQSLFGVTPPATR
jgi:hypothetical protein